MSLFKNVISKIFTNHVLFNILVKTGFSIKQPTMFDVMKPNKLTNNNHLNVCEQMADVKSLVLDNNTLSHLIMDKQISSCVFKMSSRLFI